MDCHIDWLSWTLPSVRPINDLTDLYTEAKDKMNHENRTLAKTVFNGVGFEIGPNRPPYQRAILREDHGCAVYGRSHTDTILYELSGRGCEVLRNSALAVEMLSTFGERVTRIDIACDVRTDERPADFSNQRSGSAFRSLGFMRSDAGETVYIGSAKSDRFCRVYRYDPPHPRSDLLRIEFVFRRDYAKATAASIVEANGINSVVSAAGNSFQFTSPQWRPDVKTDEKLQAPIVSRKDEDTVRWLYKACAPALARCLKSGAVDLSDFLTFVRELDE